jgi:DNA invertase Pin-like site-specific DNA recombinase
MEKAMIISRCSTNETKQDVTRQTVELKAKYSNRYEIAKVVEYYKSGRFNDEQLSEILKHAIENNIQNLLFHEISRIGRKTIETLVFVRNCTENKINVVIDNYSMHTLNEDKTENMMTKTMLQIGAAFSEVELRQTQNRLNSGRAKYIANGGVLGRSKNSLEPKEQTLDKHKDIIKYVKQGQSVRNIMKLTNKSNGTVQKVKQLLIA